MTTRHWLHQSLPGLNLPNLSPDIPQLSLESVSCPTVGLGTLGPLGASDIWNWAGWERKELTCDRGPFNLRTLPVHPGLEV